LICWPRSITLCCSLYAYKGDKARIEKTLEWYNSLTQSAGTDFNLHLVNDASDESFDDVLPSLTPKGFCKAVEYTYSEERLGKAVQLNKLLKEVKSKLVGVVDNDVILPQDWLEECAQVCMLPTISLCGILVGDELDIPNTRIREGNIHFCFPNKLGGACLVWHRETVGEEGYFWTHEGQYAHEDAEFVIRLNKRVGKVAALLKRGTHTGIWGDSEEYGKWKLEQSSTHWSVANDRILEVKEG